MMFSTLFLFALATLFSASAPAGDRLQVVAAIPDLADIAREIGGERVEVKSICRGRENLHAMTPRPSHLIALSRADVLVQLGLSAESTWLPGLLMRARNERIQPGADGFVDASAEWEAIDVPVSLSRAGGDLHPSGNPHINLSPRGGRAMAAQIHAGLVRVDPGSRDIYDRNHEAYLERLSEAEKRWAAAGEKLRGAKLAVYHVEFNYLAEAYGMEIVAALELKPGIPPTPGHLARVVETMRRDGVSVIVTATWSNNRQVREVAERTGARVLELPNMVGGTKGADTWIDMMDLVHERLRSALAGTGD